jgi:hypothetical protein
VSQNKGSEKSMRNLGKNEVLDCKQVIENKQLILLRHSLIPERGTV